MVKKWGRDQCLCSREKATTTWVIDERTYDIPYRRRAVAEPCGLTPRLTVSMARDYELANRGAFWQYTEEFRPETCRYPTYRLMLKNFIVGLWQIPVSVHAKHTNYIYLTSLDADLAEMKFEWKNTFWYPLCSRSNHWLWQKGVPEYFWSVMNTECDGKKWRITISIIINKYVSQGKK